MNSAKLSGANVSGLAGPEVEKDSHNISSTPKALQTSSTQVTPDDIQKQISEQLQQVSQCLDDVEDRRDTVQQGKQHASKGRNLSSTSHRHVKKSMFCDSESSDDESIPSLCCQQQFSVKKTVGSGN